MKAYQVTEINYEEYSRIIFAETRGKAQDEGAMELGRDFMEVKAVRAKQYDKYADDMTVSVKILLEDGWYFTCNGVNCGEEVYQDGIDAGGMIIDEKVYCPDCARKIREGERI